jgi:hypothetical protein
MKNYLITSLFILTLIYSCQKDNALVGPYPSGKFTYQSFDSLGSPIVEGWLTIEMVDTTRLKGDWYLNNLQQRDDIGLQYGEGELTGYLENSKIFLNLNPQYADHNVYLNGIMNGEVIEGNWTWATFIGPTNWGTFKASKN